MSSQQRSTNDAHDRQALASLWEQARPAVFAYLTSTVYDFHRAEDLLQEVAVAIAGQFASYNRERPFLAWALGIARNRVLLYFREHARDRHYFSEEAIRTLTAAAEQLDWSEGRSKRDALSKCLHRIDGRRRRVLEMRYSGGMKISDIAEELAVSSNAIKIILHRVRNTLEQCIRRRLAEEGIRP